MSTLEIFEQLKRIVEPHAHNVYDVKDYPWDNLIYKSHLFNWCHIEHYNYRTASIVHCVIMPNSNDAAGIFGFDIIDINGIKTGMFLDITPTVGISNPFTNHKFLNPRPIPEWGRFSEHFVCVKPENNEIKEAFSVLEYYLNSVLNTDFSEMGLIMKKQQDYVEMQRNNDKTLKMLSSHIGYERALIFMNEVLFPNII